MRYTLAISASVLVALFVQKSDGHSVVVTVFLLGVAFAGAMLIGAAVAGIVYKFHDASSPPNRLHWYLSRPLLFGSLGIVGALLLTFSMGAIDTRNPDYLQPPVGSEKVRDSESIAMRNLVLSQTDAATRFSATLVNKQNSPLVLSAARIVLRALTPDNACLRGDEQYLLSGDVEIDNENEASASLEAKRGPLEGSTVAGKGSYLEACEEKRLSISFPITLALGPMEPANLTVDVAVNIRLVRLGGYPTTGFATELRYPDSFPSDDFTSVSFYVSHDGEAGLDEASVCRSFIDVSASC